MQQFIKSKRICQSASTSKLKTIFVLVIAIYIFYAWILSPFRPFTLNYSCPLCPQLNPHNFDSPLTVSSHALETEVRFRNINRNLRLVGAAESTEELDFLLNIRKLVVFAIHKLNQPLKFTNCTTWWANPLDVLSHEEKANSEVHTDHFIAFFLQPGNLKCSVTIRQQLPPIDIDDIELAIIGSFEITAEFQPNVCEGASAISEDVKKTCLCPTGAKFDKYSKITDELRTMWNYTDQELVTWHPDKSFYIPDYMNYTDYEWFVRSPGNTTQEISQLHYSTEYCGPDLRMLVMVSSAPNHYKHRKIIRETYASQSNLKGKGIKVVFLMGIPTNDTIKEEVKREAEISGDIIQANFGDSYHNLTISHLSMYKWAHLTCIEGKDKGVTVPPFILKADDDFLLNVDLALDVAQQNSEYEFIGCLFCGTRVYRNVEDMKKYYTPRYMHISNSYAGYLSGVVYLLRTDVIPRLLHMSKTTPMIHMDDAYVSGILLRQLKIYSRGSPLLTYERTQPDACLTKKVVSSYVSNPDDMTVQYSKFIEPMPADCTLKDLKIKVDELDAWRIRTCFYTYK